MQLNGVSSHSISPGKAPYQIAAFVAEKQVRPFVVCCVYVLFTLSSFPVSLLPMNAELTLSQGKPASIKLFERDNLKTPLNSKSFFRAQVGTPVLVVDHLDDVFDAHPFC